MTLIPRLILLIIAAISLSIAVALLKQAGLPERSFYTGSFSETLGRVAPELNAIAPPIQQRAYDDRIINLLELRGNPVIINFWATWCEPCRLEMAELQTLYEDLADQGLRILGVNMGEDLITVRNWVEEMNISFDILLDETNQLSRLYRLRGQPSTFVIAPDGVITNIHYGPTRAETLRREIRPYLER